MRVHERGGMSNVCQPIRCLPSHTYSQKFQKLEVPAFFFQPESFPVQGFGHGAHFLSPHLHMSNQMQTSAPPEIYHSIAPIP